MLAERLDHQARPSSQLSVRDHDLDPFVAQDPEAATGRVLAWVLAPDHDTSDPGGPNRVGAGRRLPLMAARLERYVHRRAVQLAVAGRVDRLDLRVRLAESRVVALPEHLVIAPDHRTDERVWAHPATTVARELDRTGQVTVVGVGLQCHLRH